MYYTVKIKYVHQLRLSQIPLEAHLLAFVGLPSCFCDMLRDFFANNALTVSLLKAV